MEFHNVCPFVLLLLNMQHQIILALLNATQLITMLLVLVFSNYFVQQPAHGTSTFQLRNSVFLSVPQITSSRCPPQTKLNSSVLLHVISGIRWTTIYCLVSHRVIIQMPSLLINSLMLIYTNAHLLVLLGCFITGLTWIALFLVHIRIRLS